MHYLPLHSDEEQDNVKPSAKDNAMGFIDEEDIPSTFAERLKKRIKKQ